MNLPEWTKPALLGAGAGAIALAIAGFSWGGWVTGAAAMTKAEKDAMAAVATALTPYCLEKSKTDLKSTELLAELSKASSFKRRGIVEDAGWATPLGAEEPHRALAEACQKALKTDA